MKITDLMPQHIKNFLFKFKPIKAYLTGRNFINHPRYMETRKRISEEVQKQPTRTEIINFLLSTKEEDSIYLEIGVRNPDENFNHIIAGTKYSVDPGIEFVENPVDFALTSDEFFQQLSSNEILSNQMRFDLIFIDGLHTAEQADKDIENALLYVKDDGFIVVHDCNPPTHFNAREEYSYFNTPAGGFWNGTTWKAFLKWRSNASLYSCCIDTDWGVGILSKKNKIGEHIEMVNPFYEFDLFDKNRKEYLNLMDFETLKEVLGKASVEK